jgi:hypothetical protein
MRRQPAPRSARTWSSLAAAAALLLGGAACGSEEKSPAEAAPGLSTRLERVDAAIADEAYARAREAVEDLVAEAAQARVTGDITADQADRILQAASDLLAQLPEDDTTDESPSPGPTDIVPPSVPTDPGAETGTKDGEKEKDPGSDEDADDD